MSPDRAGARARRGAGHAAARRGKRPVGCAILTCSDTRRGARDLSGNSIARLITRAGHRVARRAWVSDDRAAIRRAARAALAERTVDVLIVTGGSGVAARDVTPEALAPLIDRPLPGFGELFRVLSMREVGTAAWLSRAGAGVARGRLVFMLPGSTSAVSLAMRRLIVPELVHLVRMLGRLPMES